MPVVSLDTIAVEPIDWLWPGHVARRSITIYSAAPGFGKTTVVLNALVAPTTTGRQFPMGSGRTDPARVLLVSAEDDAARVLRPRLEACGADVSKVLIANEIAEADGTPRLFDLTRDMLLLEDTIVTAGDVALVVLDPLGPMLGGTDSHVHSKTYATLAPLRGIAERTGVAIVLIHHDRKLAEGTAIDRLMGSRAFSALPRNVFTIIEEPADGKDRDADTPRVRILAHAKHGLSKAAPALRFTIEEAANGAAYIQWGESIDQNADDILESQRAAKDADGRAGRESAASWAGDWLKGELAGGPRPSKEIDAKAAAVGLSQSTLKRAKGRIGVIAAESRDADGKVRGWKIRLPGANTNEDDGPEDHAA